MTKGGVAIEASKPSGLDIEYNFFESSYSQSEYCNILFFYYKIKK
jgi:hypothetical protein